MKITFIATVFNEEKTIENLLNSLILQTKLPDEIIIVDAGSTDNTLSVISNFKSQISNKVRVNVLQKRGNRSVGRNEAIKNAKGDIILSSDAGCILDKDWVKNITKPFEKEDIDVVAGYYKGVARNSFQKSLIPYALVMDDKINKDEFLPATRSMAFKKQVWKKVGGFNEKLSHNEDYEFANRLKNSGARIVFAKDAVVGWYPRKNIKEAFIMFFRFALGDAESNIYRTKVIYIFLRYLMGVILFVYFVMSKNQTDMYLIILLLILYTLWAVGKNYKYVKNWKAIFILPLLQYVSDIAVILGTSLGLLYGIYNKFKI